MKKLKFVIYSPPLKSGGSYVLHQLCELLEKSGCKSSMFIIPTIDTSSYSHFLKVWMKKTIPFMVKRSICRLINRVNKSVFQENLKFQRYISEPIKCRYHLCPVVSKNTIVVYPEVTDGNPLNAQKVVRWLLHKPGFHTGRINYSKKDLFFAFSDFFNSIEYNQEAKILRISFFDENIYCQRNFEEREGTCYIIRKGKYRSDLPEVFDGPILDDYTEIEMGKAFNRYKYCISYDLATFYSTAASFCGCISIVVPESEPIQPVIKNRRGVAYGNAPAEIERAVSTRITSNQYKYEITEQNKISVDFFISECINRWA